VSPGRLFFFSLLVGGCRRDCDQPVRAIESGLISRLGTLDPTDHSTSLRYSLSAHLDKPVGEHGKFSLSLYGIHANMTLVNNFTRMLKNRSAPAPLEVFREPAA